MLKSQNIRSDRFRKITLGLKIKVVKIPQILAESESKAYPKHQKGKMDKHILTNNRIIDDKPIYQLFPKQVELSYLY